MSKVLVIIKSPGIGDLCILSKYIQEISKYSSSEVSVLAQQNTRAHEILKNEFATYVSYIIYISN